MKDFIWPFMYLGRLDRSNRDIRLGESEQGDLCFIRPKSSPLHLSPARLLNVFSNSQ